MTRERLVGFTGTGSAPGLTHAQVQQLLVLLAQLQTGDQDWFLFGLCTHADEQAAGLARRLGYQLEGFPGRPVGDPHRSLIEVDRLHEVPGGKTPELTRNRSIVARCEILLVGPGGYKEVLRSGTWATVRRAREVHRERIIVWPDGLKSTEFAGNIVPYPGTIPPAPGAPPVS